MLGWLKRDRKPQQGMSTSVLPDELVVDILSRLPLKSICRFKCVCKSWLAFSSHPYYRQKLPRTPAGLLYQKRALGTVIHLARLPAADGEIDTSLTFVPPCYKDSKLMDCSNGLLLCYQRDKKYEGIFNVVVCNPATKQWMAIPDTEPGPPPDHGTTPGQPYLRLCFDSLWSPHFYVFKFQSSAHMIPDVVFNTEVEVFFSEDSSWSGCLLEIEDAIYYGGSLFVNGVLYVMHDLDHEILAVDAPDTSSQWLNRRIIELPGFANVASMFRSCDGCLSQSSDILWYAKQELDGCAVRTWSLEGHDKWVVKHRVRMTDVFRRDVLIHSTTVEYLHWWSFDYDILAFDLERELVILVDRNADTIISVSTRTGKGLQFPNIPEKFDRFYKSLFYVPYYGKVPALVGEMAQDELCYW